MQELVTIISLLNTITVNEYHESRLINELNNFFNFDHNLYLLESSADEDRYLSRPDGFTPQSLYVSKNIYPNITGLESITEINSKNTFLIVVPETNEFDRNLLQQVMEIQRLQMHMKIGMFFSSMISHDNLQMLFEWCWEHHIINIFAAFRSQSEEGQDNLNSLNIFTFNPFGSFDLVNCTGSDSFTKYFLSRNSNFQQHTLKLRKAYIRLSDRLLWSAVLDVINASFVYVTDGEIDIWPYMYYLRNTKTKFVYPVAMDSKVVVVPESLPYSGFSAYLQNATSFESFGYSLIVISAITILLTLFRYIKQKTILFFQSAADVLNLIMNDNEYIKYQQLSRFEVCLLVPLTFAGLIITNGILSHLQSYITQPISQPQIDSLEAVYMSSYTIFTPLAITNWKERLTDVLQNQWNHRNWSVKIQNMDIDLLEEQVFTYNLSMAFLWNLYEMKSLLRVQKRLKIRGYHITQAHIQISPRSYSVNETFPFKERLDEIVFRMQSAGLYQQWRREEIRERDKIILRKNLKTYKESDADIESFSFPMFIVYGWCAGIVVLLIEIIWNKFKIPQMNRFLRIFTVKFGH